MNIRPCRPTDSREGKESDASQAASGMASDRTKLHSTARQSQQGGNDATQVDTTLRFCLAAGLALALVPDPARAQVVVKVNDTVNFRLGFQLQAWGEWLQDPISEGYQQSLFIRRVRFLLAGNLAKNVSFFMQTDNPNMGRTTGTTAKAIEHRAPHAGRVRRVEGLRQGHVHPGLRQDADAFYAQLSPVDVEPPVVRRRHVHLPAERAGAPERRRPRRRDPDQELSGR